MTGRILLISDGPAVLFHSMPMLTLLQKNGFFTETAPADSAIIFLSRLSWSLFSSRPCMMLQNLTEKILQDFDLVLVAPASLQLLNELRKEPFCSFKKPLLAAPALLPHENTPKFSTELKKNLPENITLIPPEKTPISLGRTGQLSFASPDTCLRYIQAALTPQDLAGQTVLLTAGPTIEDIDPIRFLSNRSTGKMGLALTEDALQRGADVLLIHGPLQDPIPEHPRLKAIAVRNASEMYEQTMKHIREINIAILCAAVADFTPNEFVPQKIKKNKELGLTLLLHTTPDILASLGKLEQPPYLVGFAAESNDLEQNARIKLQSKNCDLLCVNDVMKPHCGFGVSTNQITIYNKSGESESLPLLSKKDTAHKIFNHILKNLKN
ncbi:MAG: bifunctional phosphopantothenoylcysteine decarboxylase/phosphopantothenate--cysteine ligase CoaBC [Lentisphaeria bacterium]